MKYWQAPAWTSCRKAASWVSVVFQSRTKSIAPAVGEREARHVDRIAEGVLGKAGAGHVVDAPAAIGAEHFDGRDPLPEAGLSVGLDDGVEPGLERRDHRAVDGERLVDRDRAVGQRRDFQRTRHAADAGPVDFGRGTIVSERVTCLRAKQAFSACARQTGRSGRPRNPQLVRHRAAMNASNTGETRRAMTRRLRSLP